MEERESQSTGFETHFLASWAKVLALKHTVRTGWVEKGVPEPESVASHSYGVALLVLLLAGRSESELNLEKCLKLALVHDLAEAVTGDLTPSSPVSKQEKDQMERVVMQDFSQQLAFPDLIALWEEYTAAQTEEALFVKQLDKLDMILQSDYYSDQYPALNLDEFRTWALPKLKADALIRLGKGEQDTR